MCMQNIIKKSLSVVLYISFWSPKWFFLIRMAGAIFFFYFFFGCCEKNISKKTTLNLASWLSRPIILRMTSRARLKPFPFGKQGCSPFILLYYISANESVSEKRKKKKLYRNLFWGIFIFNILKNYSKENSYWSFTIHKWRTPKSLPIHCLLM